MHGLDERNCNLMDMCENSFPENCIIIAPYSIFTMLEFKHEYEQNTFTFNLDDRNVSLSLNTSKKVIK